MNLFQARFVATAAGLLYTCLAPAWSDVPAPRVVSFRVSEVCTCAECAFEARRELPRLDGVRKTTLSVKDRRLDVVFDDAKAPVSGLAAAVSRLDMGKGSALLWPVAQGGDPARSAAAIAAVPGVKAAKAEGRIVLVTFAGKPAVTLAQLDAASRGPERGPA